MCLLMMLKCLLASFARFLELVAIQLGMPLWQKAGQDTRASYVQTSVDSPVKLAGTAYCN